MDTKLDRRGFLRSLLATAAAVSIPLPAAAAPPELGRFYDVKPGDVAQGALPLLLVSSRVVIEGGRVRVEASVFNPNAEAVELQTVLLHHGGEDPMLRGWAFVAGDRERAAPLLKHRGIVDVAGAMRRGLDPQSFIDHAEALRIDGADLARRGVRWEPMKACQDPQRAAWIAL